MPKLVLVTSFSRYTDSALSTKAAHILSCMTGNLYYPTPTPALSVVEALLVAYNTANQAALDGDKVNTAIKKQKRKELQDVLSKLGLYVELNGNNDEVILLSSGYDLAKPRSPKGELPKAEDFKVQATAVGTIKLSLEKIDGANSYQFEYTKVPVTGDSEWTIVPSTKASVIITGLTSGEQYAFRVTAIGSNPTLTYSDIITSFVL